MWEKELEERITSLLKENHFQKHQIEDLSMAKDKSLDNVFTELISVIDAFDKAEAVIKERELDKSDDAQKAITRLMQAKKKLLQVFSANGVEVISYDENMFNVDTCSASETVPDAAHPDNYIVETIKPGYTRNGKVLRRADVVTVKN